MSKYAIDPSPWTKDEMNMSDAYFTLRKVSVPAFPASDGWRCTALTVGGTTSYCLTNKRTRAELIWSWHEVWPDVHKCILEGRKLIDQKSFTRGDSSGQQRIRKSRPRIL